MAPLSMQHDLEKIIDKRRPIARLVITLVTLSCLLICMFTAWEIWSSRNDRLREAEISTSNMARALALHAQTTMKVAELVLENIVERAESGGPGVDDRHRLRTHLENLSTKADELHGLFVYDEWGGWVATSLRRVVQANNADREYFQYHRKHTERGIRVGAPIRSRSTGVWIIPVSRRLDHADGSFAGVALATLRLNFFEAAYSKLDVGKTGTIMLTHDKGTLYYRRPFSEKIIGTDISLGPLMRTYRSRGPVGTAMLVARIDGVKRLYSYRHLEGFPLIVAAAISTEEIYSDWRKNSIQIISAIAIIIAVILYLGRKLLRQLVLRKQLEKQLHLVSRDLAKANDELSVMALKDGLTQMANRRAFDQKFSLEFARSQRDQSPLSLLMLDVDHFKKFNDNYGHPAGDLCLQRVARAIEGQVSRQTDLSARYGGEEFVVLLPSTDSDGACGVAERIRQAVADLELPHAMSEAGIVTVSVGVASVYPGTLRGDAPTDLLSTADAALYRSKSSGRNRVSAETMSR